MRAEKMREDATIAASAAAVKARAAEETAEDAAQKTKEAAAERERNLRDELAQAAADHVELLGLVLFCMWWSSEPAFE